MTLLMIFTFLMDISQVQAANPSCLASTTSKNPLRSLESVTYFDGSQATRTKAIENVDAYAAGMGTLSYVRSNEGVALLEPHLESIVGQTVIIAALDPVTQKVYQLIGSVYTWPYRIDGSKYYIQQRIGYTNYTEIKIGQDFQFFRMHIVPKNSPDEVSSKGPFAFEAVGFADSKNRETVLEEILRRFESACARNYTMCKPLNFSDIKEGMTIAGIYEFTRGGFSKFSGRVEEISPSNILRIRLEPTRAFPYISATKAIFVRRTSLRGIAKYIGFYPGQKEF